MVDNGILVLCRQSRGISYRQCISAKKKNQVSVLGLPRLIGGNGLLGKMGPAAKLFDND
jgi:hypothetical protein